MSKDDRPTFFLDDDPDKPLRAGGVLFYRKNPDTNNYELMLIHSRGKYEDFGGCTDKKDKNIIGTVTREVYEESNKIFRKKFIRSKLKKSEPLYIKYCKYALYFIELKYYYDPEIFGDREIHDNIRRTVEWISYDKFLENNFYKKLNFRLKIPTVNNKLKDLFI